MPGLVHAHDHQRNYGFSFDAVMKACITAASEAAVENLDEGEARLVFQRHSASLASVTIKSAGPWTTTVVLRSQRRPWLPWQERLSVIRFWTRFQNELAGSFAYAQDRICLPSRAESLAWGAAPSNPPCA